MKNAAPILIVALALTLILLFQTLFIVDQKEQAIVLQFGQPVGNAQDTNSFVKGPGLHAKIPLIQNVVRFDRRILSVDPASEQVVISSDEVREKKQQTEDEENSESEYSIENVTAEPIIVDTFARYKIIDPIQFLKTLGNIRTANIRITNNLVNATKAELGKTTLEQLLSQQRTRVMGNIQKRVNKNVEADNYGIEIVDVRIVRADLTQKQLGATTQRMKSELKERATETRAKGEEQALEIRSKAEKQKQIILANAQRDAEILKGEGDETAITTYAEAFNKDKEFYAFIRTMEAYKKTLGDKDTRLILSPDSEFFKRFKQGNR